MGLCCAGLCAGCRPRAEALDAPGQYPRGAAGVVQGPLVGGLLEELLRVVACGFGFGEGSGEGVEGGVFDDLLHVIGHGPAYLADVPVHGLPGRPVLGEGGQGCGCGLFVGGLEVEQGLLGGADLLVVVAEPVPSGGGDDDEDRGVEEHCQGGAVLGRGLAEHGAYGAAQGTDVMVFGPDAGAGGALERGRRLTRSEEVV